MTSSNQNWINLVKNVQTKHSVFMLLSPEKNQQELQHRFWRHDMQNINLFNPLQINDQNDLTIIKINLNLFSSFVSLRRSYR